jgi:beta-lactamase class C
MLSAMKRLAAFGLLESIAFRPAWAAADPADASIRALSGGEARALVARAVAPVMKRYGIPGMAAGMTVRGRHYVYAFGVASKATGRPVEDSTLFEIGSITKTFTASLAAYAELTGRLSLHDEASADFPSVRGTSFDRLRLLDLATHLSGGLPLQFRLESRPRGPSLRYARSRRLTCRTWRPSRRAASA